MRRIPFFLLALFLAAGTAAAQVDTTYFEGGQRVHQLEPVTVTSSRASFGRSRVMVEKDALHQVMERSGVGLIRRGSILGSDIYVDGFKRGDIEMVIDGERYPNSCPNRMDPPAVRLNPLEVDEVELDRSSAVGQAGLGGRLSFHRAVPQHDWLIRGGLSQSGGSELTTDASLALERRGHRLSGRVLRGGFFEDGDGRSFGDLYGFRSPDAALELYEASLLGTSGGLGYGVSASFARNLAFPYLLMDERTNDLLSGHIEYAGRKLYVNRTRHVMDNGLRTSHAMMQMESVAENVTVGLAASKYEAYYRNWNVDNRIVMGGGATRIDQASVPDLHLGSVSVFDERSIGGLTVAGRVGLHVVGVGIGERMDFYRQVNPDAERQRVFVPVAASVSRSRLVGAHVVAGASLEVAVEPPAPEYLYIGIQRSPARPWWTGNPTLSSQKRASVRMLAGAFGVDAEIFGSLIRDYAALETAVSGEQRFVTYEGIDAAIAGASMSGSWRHIDAAVRYTIGFDETNDEPLAEVQPLTFGATLRTPAYSGAEGFVRIDGASAQKRVSTRLDESSTPSWVRLDAGVAVAIGHTTIAAEVANLFDALYYEHLSYQRDPFASGLRVYAPGRSARLSLRARY